jgi:hypothetical protein
LVATLLIAGSDLGTMHSKERAVHVTTERTTIVSNPASAMIEAFAGPRGTGKTGMAA